MNYDNGDFQVSNLPPFPGSLLLENYKKIPDTGALSASCVSSAGNCFDTSISADKYIDVGYGASPIADHHLYAEMEIAEGFAPPDRADTIYVAKTASSIYSYLKVFEKTLVHLMATEDSYVTMKDANGKQKIWLNRKGSYLAKMIQNYPELMLEGKTLSCRLEAFREVLENLGGVETFTSLPGEASYSHADLIEANFVPKCRAGLIHRIVSDLQKIGNSRRFIKRLEQANDRSELVLDKMVAVIHNLFQFSSKLLVVRIDFEYRLEARTEVTSRKAKKDLRKFLNNIRHQTVFNDLLGYIWKTEQGIFGGFHFHTFFFFDGNCAQHDIILSMALGKYWIKVTEGRGAFHSCNAKKGAYRYLGIGKISHADLSMQSGLLIALKYLAESDKAQSVPSERAFGFSKALEVTPKSLGGRPRSASASTIFTQWKNDDGLEVTSG